MIRRKPGLRILLSLQLFVLPLLLFPGFVFAGQADRLVAAALKRIDVDVRYDGSYQSLAYPGGDVPDTIGVCSDLVIRSYRALGIDLQLLVHEDISAHFGDYPARWGLSRPDANIDHRRVYNLMVFFHRSGASLPLVDGEDPFLPGDLVSWDLGGGVGHIGIVSRNRSADRSTWKMIHNIGAGPVEEDCLNRWEIIGHYRYFPDGIQLSH